MHVPSENNLRQHVTLFSLFFRLNPICLSPFIIPHTLLYVYRRYSHFTYMINLKKSRLYKLHVRSVPGIALKWMNESMNSHSAQEYNTAGILDLHCTSSECTLYMLNIQSAYTHLSVQLRLMFLFIRELIFCCFCRWNYVRRDGKCIKNIIK